MQMQPRPQRKQLVRIAAIVLASACTAVIAILLGGAPFSSGDASDNAVPARFSALSVPAGTPREAFADQEIESAIKSTDAPTEPNCAQLGGIVSTEEPETFAEPSAVGCDMFSHLAAGAPASDQSDVDAYLAWHVEARDLIQDAYQTGLWDIREQ